MTRHDNFKNCRNSFIKNDMTEMEMRWSVGKDEVWDGFSF